MPSIKAKRQCPDLIFVKPKFDVYKEISQQMRAIFAEYTPLFEPLSLDEAYLDVTDNLRNIISATEIAEEIRARIRAATDLTASAGVSYNKFLAKLASDHRKPDGLFVITPKMGPAFVETLPVRKFHGVGPATAAKMMSLGIETGLDLKARSLALLQEQFGKAGPYYYWIARGRSDPRVCRRGKHLRRGPLHFRCGARRAAADCGQGLALKVYAPSLPLETGRAGEPSSTAPIGSPQSFRAERKRCNGTKKMLLVLQISEATMSAHAFEVLSRARDEIVVCHTAEGHRFKFFVVTNAHGKKILSESIKVIAKEGATHTPEFFSGSARAFAITVAHRSHIID